MSCQMESWEKSMDKIMSICLMELAYWSLTQNTKFFQGKLLPNAYFIERVLVSLKSFLVKILTFLNERNAEFMK